MNYVHLSKKAFQDVFPRYFWQFFVFFVCAFVAIFCILYFLVLGHLPPQLGHWVVYLFEKYMIKFTFKVYKLARDVITSSRPSRLIKGNIRATLTFCHSF